MNTNTHPSQRTETEQHLTASADSQHREHTSGKNVTNKALEGAEQRTHELSVATNRWICPVHRQHFPAPRHRSTPMPNPEVSIAMTNQTPNAAERNSLVSDRRLSLQDEYYAKNRLPYETPPGADDRTFCFHVALEHHLCALSHMLEWAIELWWSSPTCPQGDASAKMTLKPGVVTRNELRWLFARLPWGRHAMETIELERDYTGERKHLGEHESDVEEPSIDALKASLKGLENFREALDIADEQALQAEEELGMELKDMYWDTHVAHPSHASSQPLRLTPALT